MTTQALRFLCLLFPGVLLQEAGHVQVQSSRLREAGGYTILFERMGGYAGRHDRFWIYPDGRIEDARGIVKETAAGRVLAFKQSIDPLLLPAAQAAPARISLCCDCYTYRITIRDRAGVRFATLSEPLRVKTDRLASLIQQLRDLVFDR